MLLASGTRDALPVGMRAEVLVLLVATANLVVAGGARSDLVTGFEGQPAGSVPAAPAAVVAGHVTVETGAGFSGGAVAAPEGSSFAYLTTGPGATGAGSSGQDRGGAFGFENDAAIMTVDFVAAQESILSYRWNWLTAETFGGFVDADVPSVLLDGVETFITPVTTGGAPVSGPDGSIFDNGLFSPSWMKRSFVVGPGNHTIEFYVGDDVDDLGDSALLVDDIQLVPVVELPVTGFEGDVVGSPPAAPASVVAGHVTVETGAGFTGDLIDAPEGSKFAYLTTGPGATGAGDSGENANLEFGNENDIAVMQVSFTAPADGSAVLFDSRPLSSEGANSPVLYDAFLTRIDGTWILSGQNPVFPAGTETTGPDASVFDNGAFGTGFEHYAIFDLAAGPHTLEFLVGDEVDDLGDSALLVDDIRLLPEPGAGWQLGFGVGGLALLSRAQPKPRRRNRRVERSPHPRP
jgi:hypothetical protein